MKRLLIFVFIAAGLTACYRMKTSKGGGQIASLSARKISVADILLMPGFKIELVADG